MTKFELFIYFLKKYELTALDNKILFNYLNGYDWRNAVLKLDFVRRILTDWGKKLNTSNRRDSRIVALIAFPIASKSSPN